jgi:hypothetical protein
MDLVTLNRARLRTALAACLLVLPAFAATFSLRFGSAIAGQGQVTKSTPFVFRFQDCEDLPHTQVTGSAEGMEYGARRSLPLHFASAPGTGVYYIATPMPSAGVWVVSLTAGCGAQTLGAIVPIGPNGFIRESVVIVAHPPTSAETEAALKALGPAGK